MILAIFLYIAYVYNKIFIRPNVIFTRLGWVDVDFFLPLVPLKWQTYILDQTLNLQKILYISPSQMELLNHIYLDETSNISHTLVSNEIVDHSYSFSTHLASMDWAKTKNARRDKNHLSFGIWCDLY